MMSGFWKRATLQYFGVASAQFGLVFDLIICRTLLFVTFAAALISAITNSPNIRNMVKLFEKMFKHQKDSKFVEPASYESVDFAEPNAHAKKPLSFRNHSGKFFSHSFTLMKPADESFRKKSKDLMLRFLHMDQNANFRPKKRDLAKKLFKDIISDSRIKTQAQKGSVKEELSSLKKRFLKKKSPKKRNLPVREPAARKPDLTVIEEVPEEDIDDVFVSCRSESLKPESLKEDEISVLDVIDAYNTLDCDEQKESLGSLVWEVFSLHDDSSSVTEEDSPAGLFKT